MPRQHRHQLLRLKKYHFTWKAKQSLAFRKKHKKHEKTRGTTISKDIAYDLLTQQSAAGRTTNRDLHLRSAVRQVQEDDRTSKLQMCLAASERVPVVARATRSFGDQDAVPSQWFCLQHVSLTAAFLLPVARIS